MILLCLIFILSITEQISTKENNVTNITVLNVQPDTNLSQRLYHGLKGGSLIQKRGKAPKYVPSESKLNQTNTHSKTNKKDIEPKKNNKPKEKINEEENFEMKTRINSTLKRKSKKNPKKKPKKKYKKKSKKKSKKKPKKKLKKKPKKKLKKKRKKKPKKKRKKKPKKKSKRKPKKKPKKKSRRNSTTKLTMKPNMEVEENEVNHTKEIRNASKNLGTKSTTQVTHNFDEYDNTTSTEKLSSTINPPFTENHYAYHEGRTPHPDYVPIAFSTEMNGEFATEKDTPDHSSFTWNEHKPEIYKKEDNSTIPKTTSPCCNAEIINIFHEMDLESRHVCFKLHRVLELSLKDQTAIRGCIAGCVAIQNRYLTNNDKLLVNEYANNLKYAFRELRWTTAIMDAIVTSCVDKFEFHNEFSMGCETKTYEIGACIGRKLQFECYANHLHDSSEDNCSQDLLDATYSKCTNPSPGYGCHVIR